MAGELRWIVGQSSLFIRFIVAMSSVISRLIELPCIESAGRRSNISLGRRSSLAARAWHRPRSPTSAHPRHDPVPVPVTNCFTLRRGHSAIHLFPSLQFHSIFLLPPSPLSLIHRTVICHPPELLLRCPLLPSRHEHLIPHAASFGYAPSPLLSPSSHLITSIDQLDQFLICFSI